ncbi:MAG: stage II sporulation protein M, partial [Flavobacteriia bacterium]|nr:stage II sporulation protein M [Flavobacteriia bacterium]
CISTQYDKDFAKYTLGEDYIKTTETNIANGNPMGIYKQDNTIDMFMQIAINNLRIDFMMFVLGALLSIGTIMFVIYNGVMLGTFQYFFYLKGLLLTTALTIWLHGTLEMSMMVIVAAAGITMGKGLLFPGSYKRLHSFQISALRGIKIFLSVLPFTFTAAIIETWVTRHTEAPTWIKLILIIGSFLFVVGYFYILPLYKNKKGHFDHLKTDFDLPPDNDRKPEVMKFNSNDEIFRDIFWFIRKNHKTVLWGSIGLAVVSAIISIILFGDRLLAISGSQVIQFFFRLVDFKKTGYIFLPLVLIFTAIFSITIFSLDKHLPSIKSNRNKIIRTLLAGVFASVMFLGPFYISYTFGVINTLLIFPVTLMFFVGLARNEEKKFAALSYVFTDFWKFVGMTVIVYLISAFIYTLFTSGLSLLMTEMITANLPVDDDVMQIFTIFLDMGLSLFIISILLFIWVYSTIFLYYSLKEIATAEILQAKISNIGKRLKTT